MINLTNVLLVKYGEIALRGSNRRLFENRLINDIRKNIDKDGIYYVTKEQGRILIENRKGEFDYDYIISKVKPVLGIVALCPCIKTQDQSIDNLCTTALSYMQTHFSGRRFTFKVETKRADKRYPIDSRTVSATVGEYILNNMENAAVDVRNPDALLYVELRNDAYIYSGVIKGFGGLPAGCTGKGMLLLSGGIDSPVAGFMMAKRGVELSCVYFHSPPYTSERALIKVCDLANRLSRFTGHLTLNVVPFTDIQLILKKNVPSIKLTILIKRAMLKIAEILAEEEGCQCLITGDSIGQVASQTMHSIHAISSGVRIPVLRPLSGMDKGQIIDISKQIETFEISIRPYEDCCTLFVDKHPETKPKTYIIELIEADVEGLSIEIDKAVAGVKKYKYGFVE